MARSSRAQPFSSSVRRWAPRSAMHRQRTPKSMVKPSVQTPPFFLVYGAEAVLPSELTIGSPRTSQYTKSEQDDRRLDDINFIEELRCRAALRAARYHQAATMSVRSRADPLLLATWCSIAFR